MILSLHPLSPRWGANEEKEFFKEIGRFEDAASGIRYIDAGD